jgi:signal transduction histidine kinase
MAIDCLSVCSRADRIQLQQVILNLMMNAIEAMSGVSEGPRELLVRSGIDGSKQVEISVQDSGPGIDPESLDHLFEAFYTTKAQGLGMGLAISRSIIDAHGGRLWASAKSRQRCDVAVHLTDPWRESARFRLQLTKLQGHRDGAFRIHI